MTGYSLTEAGEQVKADLTRGLPQFEIGAFRPEPGLDEPSGVRAVVWEADARLVQEFLGAEPRDEPVVLRGVTLVKEGDDGSPLFRRYIDWLDLLNVLGLNGVMRPVRVMKAGEQARPS